MLLRIICTILAVLLVSACSHQKPLSKKAIQLPEPVLEESCNPIVNGYRSAVVKLMDFQGSTASGVVVAKNRILTVAHALGNHDLYADINGTPTQARTLSHNTELDLAYLEVDTQHIEPVKMTSTSLNTGEPVWIAGFPLANHQRISTGYFQSAGNGRYYTSVHINHGTSGGALMRCEKGLAKLAGIVHGYVGIRREGAVINIGDSTSVSATTIKTFLQSQAGIPGERLSAL